MTAYSNLSKEQLIAEIKRLKKGKKFGLLWEDKPEDVAELCKTKLPILVDAEDKGISDGPHDPTNIMIEGDNYHALSVLNYTHKGAIDVIYIDPPYNTGAKTWRYNNNYVEKDDAYRHSKWLSFMSKRLRLAYKLLPIDGFLICAIDDNELHTIGLLLNEIFGENNRLGLVTVLHNPKGRNQSKFFSANSEFMLVYARNIDRVSFNKVALNEEVQLTFDLEDDQGKYRLEPFMRARTVWSRENRPLNWYPIFVSKDLTHITSKKNAGYHEIYPITNDGKEMAWKNIKETFDQLNHGDYFTAKKENDKIIIYHKYREQQVLKNVWIDQKYQSEFHGTNLLKRILGKNIFDYPKSLYLLIDILKLTTKKDSIVLDFFAGSGTTGHAVLDLNNSDKGSRRFIICTNNENNIAEDVCYPRIKKVITGYKDSKGEKFDGLGGNLKYFRTDFVDADPIDKNKKKLTEMATEMLCLKENTFEKIMNKKAFKIYKNTNHYTGIIFDQMAIPDFKEAIAKMKGRFSVYVFSLGDDPFEEEFDDVKQKVILSPIPEVILRVYRRIFK